MRLQAAAGAQLRSCTPSTVGTEQWGWAGGAGGWVIPHREGPGPSAWGCPEYQGHPGTPGVVTSHRPAASQVAKRGNRHEPHQAQLPSARQAGWELSTAVGVAVSCHPVRGDNV